MSEYGKFQAAIQVAQDMRKDVVDAAMRVRGHRREIEAVNAALTEAATKAIAAGNQADEKASLAASDRAAAEAARDEAKAWAESPKDEPVADGHFSALHYALQAAVSAAAAHQSALQAAHIPSISVTVSDAMTLHDGGWYVCRDYHMEAHFTRLRMEVISGEGDAGEWTFDIDGNVFGPVSLTSDDAVVFAGLSIDLMPGSTIVAYREGGDETQFAVLIQIDGRP